MEKYIINEIITRGIYYDEKNKTLVDDHPDNWTGSREVTYESTSLKTLLEKVCESLDVTYSHDSIYCINQRRSEGYTTIKMVFEKVGVFGMIGVVNKQGKTQKFVLDVAVDVKKIITTYPSIVDVES